MSARMRPHDNNNSAYAENLFKPSCPFCIPWNRPEELFHFHFANNKTASASGTCREVHQNWKQLKPGPDTPIPQRVLSPI